MRAAFAHAAFTHALSARATGVEAGAIAAPKLGSIAHHTRAIEHVNPGAALHGPPYEETPP